MHIQQIEIDNFKSFAGKTTIPFLRGFTTVSGPNGSGKSNIVDSVLFCLGLSSSRTMRAEKLTDLINNTSRRRDAMVTITFNRSGTDIPLPPEWLQRLNDDDPSADPMAHDELLTDAPPKPYASAPDKPTIIGAEFNGKSPDDADLVTIARRIKESPSGYTSTYYLEGKPSTLTEIHEFLAQYNVSPGCYNVMMQGDVASIVNMSALERRKIIDELAGIAEFDRKIDQAQTELDATAGNIDRNQILLGEIETRLEQLSGERDKALKYQSLKQQRQQLEAQQGLIELKALVQQLDASRQNLTEAQQAKRAAQEALTTLRQQIDQTTKDLQTASEAVKRKGEDHHIALQKQIETLKSHADRKQQAIRFLNEQITENERQMAKQQQECERLTQRLEAFDQQVGLLQQQDSELTTLFDQEEATFQRLSEQMDALADEDSEITLKRNAVRRELETVEETLASLRREQRDWEAEQERLERDKQRQNQSLSEAQSRELSLKKRYDGLAKSFEELEARKAQLEETIRQASTDRTTLQASLNRSSETLQTLQRDYTRLESRHKAYEEMNFGRSVELILNANLPGVHGTLSQLASVDDAYSLAMEIALGGRLQNIVVDDDQTAKDGIRFLQQNRGGRATFLPLTKMRRAVSVGLPPNYPGVVDYALNLVQFDAQYETVFAYALGDTLIVEDLESARPLMNRYRMVTLDGSVLEKSGAMTGGSQPGNKRGGSVFSSSQLEAELSETRHKLDAAQEGHQKLERLFHRVQQQLDEANADHREVWQQHSRHLAELASLEEQLALLRREVAGLSAASGDGEATNTEGESAPDFAGRETLLTAQKTTLQAQLNELEQSLANREGAGLREALAEARFQREYYDSQRRNVQAELKQVQVERQIRAGAMEDYRQQSAQKATQNEQYRQEIAEHEAEIATVQGQLTELEAQTLELDDELKQLQAERDAVQTRLLELEKQRHGLERQSAQCEEQMMGCRARLAVLEPQVADKRHTLTEQGLDVEGGLLQPLPTVEELQRQLQKQEKAMQALEPVNMLAIAEYDNVTARRTELTDKVDTLTREQEALRTRIASYQDLKRVYFMKAFDQVNHHFKSIYAELSDGHGQLVLTMPADPLAGGLTIEASPRGKKTQRLEAMSGGEKSLTSLAFVFALQRTMPAPFYALDEVDQNLDGLNVEKLARMVRRESATAQFIVVSLRKPMIENSDRTVGVTQKRNGISKVTGIELRALAEPVGV